MSDERDATQIFEEHAGDYLDRLRRQLIPPFDEFYGAAIDALALAAAPPRRVLDLGAGTGLLAQLVLDAHPGAEVVLLDGAPAMLEQARAALGDRAAYVQGDLTDPLPAGPWDAIVSAVAIHHLDDDAKRALFARIHHDLSPGGVFVNAEQVTGPTALFADHYVRWQHEGAIALGASEQEWEATVERMRADRWATVEHQLAWLREAGFGDADCLFKQRGFAVMVARRSG